jgi:hypothetical protein
VLAVVILLLLAVGMMASFRLGANKAVAPAAADTQPAARSDDSKAKTAAPQQPQQSGQSAGAPVGATAALGTGANGGSAAGSLPTNPTQPAQPVEQRDKPSGNASAQDAAGGGQAANAVAGFLGALSNAVGGAHPHDPVDFHTLEALLPSSLAGMQPAPPGGDADETMSIKTTSAHVSFSGPDDARINLSIKDATAISGLAGLADMANAESSEQGDSYEKTETIDGRSVHEKWDAAARHGELSLSVGQRFAVDVVGDHVTMDALKSALARIDLAKLESMKDANPVAK